MDKLYIPFLILLTTVGGYLLFRRRLNVTKRELLQAICSGLELIGCWITVYVANLFLAFVIILLVRKLTGFFISLYILEGSVLVWLTFLQALFFFHLWRLSGRR